jgi:tol-pal system protein YbgF
MRRRLVLLCGVAMFLALTTAVPQAAADKEHRQIMADIRMLQQQNQALQAQLAALTDVLRDVKTKLDDQSGTSRKGFADQKTLVDALGADLRVVREKVDETNVRLSSLAQEVDAIRTAQPPAGAPAGPPANPAAPAGAGDPSAQPPQPPQAAPGSFGSSPSKAFEAARSDYFAANWSLAIQGFESFIKNFPKSDMIDDAQYYIGESHFGAGKYKEAVAAYDRVIATYPASNTLPDAYYKRGVALNALGQIQPARDSFDFVIKNYPTSDTATLAKQALDRLSRIGKQA